MLFKNLPWGLPRTIFLLLVAAIAFDLSTGIASILASRQARQADAWVRHTFDVKIALNALLKDLDETGSNERGYLLTGRASFLDDYDQVVVRLHQRIADLRKLTANDPADGVRVARIGPLVDAKLAEWRRTIDLWKKGQRQKALEIVSSDASISVMRALRSDVTTLQDKHDRLLRERQDHAVQSRLWVLALILTSLFASMVSVVLILSIAAHFAGRLRADAAALNHEIKLRKAAEETLLQSQKLEAIGQLTGGVAHDFNNMLTVVLGNLEAMRRRIAKASDDQIAPPFAAVMEKSIGNAMHAGESGANLVRRLLTFARRQALDPQPLDLNGLVSGLSEMMRRTLGESVEVQVVLGAGLWKTFADPSETETALLNLVVNARDAMPDGGRLTIETANTSLDKHYVARFGDVEAGQYVLLSVTDTGVGMAPETLAHIFEPFFTTKAEGKGTGLGLAMVYGLVKQSGGHILLYSEPGEGTSVKIYLPRFIEAAGVSTPDAASSPEEEAAPPRARDDETVLLVEDNEGVRDYAVAMLRDLGYRVIEANDAPAALKVLESDEKIDFVFSDVVLPAGMNGAALAKEVARLRPGLPVLLTTGYTRNAILKDGFPDSPAQLLNKPYTMRDLAGKLRDMLDRAA